MLEKSDIALTLTAAARERIGKKLSEPGFEEKVPALMLEQTSADILTWRITYYDRDSVASADFKALLIRAEGVELIVPQWNFAELIQGGILDWTGATYTLNGKAELEVRRTPK